MDDQTSPRILSALWRYRWTSLAIVVAVTLLSLAAAFLFADRTAATARIVLKAPDKVGIVGVDAQTEAAFVRYVNQRALFVLSDRVLAGAGTTLGGTVDPDSLRKEITAEAAANGESIQVRVDAGDTDGSVNVANAVTRSYQDQSRADIQSSARQTLDTLGQRRREVVDGLPPGQRNSPNVAAAQALADLDQQASQVQVAADQLGDGVSFVDKAVPDDAGLLGSLARDGVIGLALGALLAAAVAWVRADRDRRVLDADDLTEATGGGPVLAEVEALDEAEVAPLREVGSPPLWPYQFAASGLRTAVERGVVVVTSPGSADGATTSTLQMATAAARAGARVLVVDAAVRSHGLSDVLGLRYDPHGLTSVAVGAKRPDACTRVVDLGDRVYLWAVPAGQWQEATLDHFRSSLLQKAVVAMRGAYDLVLVDCSAPSVAPEVAPVIGESDAVVVVVRRDQEVRAVRRLREQIGLLGGTVSGYLFTFARPRRGAPRRTTSTTRATAGPAAGTATNGASPMNSAPPAGARPAAGGATAGPTNRPPVVRRPT